MSAHIVPFYASDLAYIHHTAFTATARAAAATLLRRLGRAGVRDGLVVDLGCGSGVTARLLTDAGFDVLGVDFSADFVALAREHAPAAQFVQASAYDVDLPRCVAVTAVGEPLCYAADPAAGREQLARLFGRVFRALQPGGLFLFDVSEPGRERGRRRRTWHEGPDWLLCLEAAEDATARTLTRRITAFRRAADGQQRYRRIDETHVQRLYPREDVLADLADAGFQARTLAGYGSEVRFRRRLAGFLAIRGR
jgi:SAM-dependent methyltransferase